jgi:16S rRNA (guanine(966)-N(2))-methyltransferase RsmD
MRIIAGLARGREILSMPMDSGVKPISGRIRQSLFDILRPKVTACRFLDLFAGTGAVGLEALSRGAERAVFVERDPRCVAVIERNLRRFGWEDRASVLRADALGPLSWVPFRSGVKGFDLVFLGPPYRDGEGRPLQYCARVLAAAAGAGLLGPGAWAVAQHHQNEDFPPPAGLEMFRRERYGDSRLSFLRHEGPARVA